MTVIVRPVFGLTSRFFWRFGKSLRLTFTLEWETSCPVDVFLPVMMQDLDIQMRIIDEGSIAEVSNTV